MYSDALVRCGENDAEDTQSVLPALETWSKDAQQALRACQIGLDLIQEWCVHSQV